MFVDTHMHEMTCSKDSFLKFLCRETLLHLELKNIRMREFPRRTLLIW